MGIDSWGQGNSIGVMPDADVDTSRVTVRTYVPAYQRDEWDEEAEKLDMSRSEFVRSMVQAGRSEFDLGSGSEISGNPDQTNRDEQGDGQQGETDGTELEQRVVDVLHDADFLSWEELVTELTDDIERRLEDALQELQAENRIRYSGRHGGYTLDDE